MASQLTDFRTGKKIRPMPDGSFEFLGMRIYVFDAAITANVTTTTSTPGSWGITTHATGRDKIFISDGSKWHNIAPNNAQAGATADAAALTAVDLTDTSGGSANGTLTAPAFPILAENSGEIAADPTGNLPDLTAVTDPVARTALREIALHGNAIHVVCRNNCADLAAQHDALRVDLAATRAQLNAALAALRSAGLMQT